MQRCIHYTCNSVCPCVSLYVSANQQSTRMRHHKFDISEILFGYVLPCDIAFGLKHRNMKCFNTCLALYFKFFFINCVTSFCTKCVIFLFILIPFVTNFISHMSHWNGLSPVCIRMWIFRGPTSLKPLPQYSQLCENWKIWTISKSFSANYKNADSYIVTLT